MLVAVVSTAIAIFSWQQARGHARAAIREAERAAAAEAGVAVAVEAGRKDLLARLAEASAKNATLRAELARALEAVPGASPTEVIEWRIESPVTVRESNQIQCGESQHADCPAVVVDVRGVEARLETEAGTLLAAGSVTIERISPEPRETWVRPWRVEIGDWQRLAAVDPADGWSVGLGGGLISGEPALAALIESPAWRPRLGRWQPEVGAWGLVAAGSGEWAVFAGVHGMW